MTDKYVGITKAFDGPIDTYILVMIRRVDISELSRAYCLWGQGGGRRQTGHITEFFKHSY